MIVDGVIGAIVNGGGVLPIGSFVVLFGAVDDRNYDNTLWQM